MKDHYDPWYVRLPDGRVVKAKSTAAVRHHVEAGHFPLTSRVRREKNGEWVSLGWNAEFADLVQKDGKTAAEVSPPKPTPSKADFLLDAKPSEALELETLGIRGMVEDLYASCDHAIRKDKILLGGLFMGLALVVKFAIEMYLPQYISNKFLLQVLAHFSMGAILIVGAVWLARQTHWELSRSQQVPLAEGIRGSLGPIFISIICIGFVVFLLEGFSRLLHFIPTLIFTDNAASPIRDLMHFGLVLAAMPIFLVGMAAMLLVPIPAIEEYSLFGSLKCWRKLYRGHFGQILFFQSFAVVLGIIASLPLLLAYYAAYDLAMADMTAPPSLLFPMLNTLLSGLILGPLFAFVVVANVILYLKLRYSFTVAK
jgi:hypothetical protein